MELYRGNIIHTPERGRFEALEHGYLAVENGVIRGTYKELPTAYSGYPVTDYGEKLIIPGFHDMHVHAPQWCNAGMGFSMELLPWLNAYAFPAEAHFADPKFAEEEYRRFVNELIRQGTTSAVIFGSRHKEATRILIELLRKSGIRACVGKVNMDRNSIRELQETTGDSLRETEELVQWMQETRPGTDDRVQYMLTPRYVPCTTSELMEGLGRLAQEYDLPVQSHLDENLSEVAWVRELHPERKSFADVYDYYGLLRPGKTVMAHCIHMTEEEVALLQKKRITVAHCAMSNADLASGIMPLRKYLEKGLDVAIASDMGGSHSVNMREHIVDTIKCSKLYWFYHKEAAPVTFAESFSMATLTGENFFGKTGCFREGYAFDALIINDESIQTGIEHDPLERLERFVYLGDSSCIEERFVAGRECNPV